MRRWYAGVDLSATLPPLVTSGVVSLALAIFNPTFNTDATSALGTLSSAIAAVVAMMMGTLTASSIALTAPR